jgi:hypothetical protein
VSTREWASEPRQLKEADAWRLRWPGAAVLPVGRSTLRPYMSLPLQFGC